MNSRVKDLAGKKYGRLTVVGFIGTKGGRAQWLCSCSCGNMTTVLSNNLRHTKDNHCGKCSKLPLSERFTRMIYRDYRHRAAKRSIDFSLTLGQFSSFLTNNCFYCGGLPVNIKQKNGKSMPYNGIDRIDSNAGYSQDNCRSCCSDCNYMKSDYDEKVFAILVKKIYSHWAKDQA